MVAIWPVPHLSSMLRLWSTCLTIPVQEALVPLAASKGGERLLMGSLDPSKGGSILGHHPATLWLSPSPGLEASTRLSPVQPQHSLGKWGSS